MKKLGLFLFNNDNNHVDDYIRHLLEDITPNLSHLCVIINNNGDNEVHVHDVFEEYTDDIFITDKFKNMDIWKEVIVNYIGLNKLINYDEIILFDDSFFGPIYPFKEIFNNTDNINLDFWTILSNGLDDKLNSSNLQFIAFRNNLIKSADFKEFWMSIDNKNFKNKNCENYFINYFSNSGFKWKNYLEIINNELNNVEPLFSIFDVFNSVSSYKLPLINIKPFILPKKTHLTYTNGLDLSLTMDYLNQNTNYDVSLIYRHLLKIIDPNTVVNLLNLKKIIPKENFNKNYKSDKSIVVIAHIYYMDLLDYDFMYLRNIPDYIDIIITTDDNDKKVYIEENYLSKLNNNSKVILVNSRGRDMSGLFVGCKDIIKNYDYFCFVHDKKSSQLKINLNATSFRDMLWENTLASEDYINYIIKSFDDNECLGLMVPPRLYYGAYFANFYNNHWIKPNLINAKKLINKMNISMDLNMNTFPLSLGNCFWAKYDALKPLFDLNLDYEDFPPEPMPVDGEISHAIERIYGHVAASQGFYTEFVMTDNYGSNEITNYPYMLSELLMIIRHRFDKKFRGYFFETFLNKFKRNLKDLDKSIRKRDKELKKLKNSNSWKLTKPLRTISFKFKSFKNKLLK